ncbi:MAG: pimeloyl-ACP methyl ester carboxylesterase [Paraglaciecola psychrophila]
MVGRHAERFKQEYPFASHRAKINDLDYHYIDEGHGPAVIMVHGNPSWSFYYRNLVKRLRGDHRCIVPDHIGCGFSARPDLDSYNFTLQSRVDDFAAFIDGLNIEGKISIVAHDWGGMIATAWAVDNAERIDKLVMLNTAAFHLPENKRFPFALGLIRDSFIGKFLVQRFNAFSIGASWLGCKMAPMSSELRQLFQLPYSNSELDRLATLQFVLDIPLREQDASYALVSATQAKLQQLADKPLLLGWGLKDFVFDKHFLAVWQQHFPSAQSVVYEHGGHYILEDAGADLEHKIAAFLAENSA